MLHVAWSVCVSVCLCVGHTDVLCKTAELMKMPFGADLCGSKEPCIRSGQDWMNAFTTMSYYFGHFKKITFDLKQTKNN